MSFMNNSLILFVIFGAFLADNNTACPNIISRSAWEAEQPRAVAYLIIPLPYVVIHHTVTPHCLTIQDCSSRVKNIQNYHMNELQWDDVGFSFFIGGDGNVYEGVGWNKEGAHTYGWNKKSAGVAFIGNFQGKMVYNWRSGEDRTRQEIINRVNTVWNELAADVEYTRKLVNSMPTRFQAVIDSNGYWTNY